MTKITVTKITNDQSKMDLVARLVKEGTIDFAEAMKLLEVETEFVSVNTLPPANPSPWDLNRHPFSNPFRRTTPLDPYNLPTVMYYAQ